MRLKAIRQLNIEEGAFTTALANVPISLFYAIESDSAIRCNFTIRGGRYSFHIKTWAKRKLSQFLKFHEADTGNQNSMEALRRTQRGSRNFFVTPRPARRGEPAGSQRLFPMSGPIG